LGNLLAPENLFFELPLLFAIVLTLIQLIGGLEAGHDLHADVGHDLAHDVGDGSIHDVGQDQPGHIGVRDFLGFLGIGKVPLFIAIALFCYCWAFFGFISLRLLSLWFPVGLYVWLSVVITLLLALFATRSLAGVLGHFFRTASYGVTMSELVGSEAKTRIRVTSTFGTAELRDRFGTTQVVECRIAASEEIIQAGASIILYQWLPEKAVFHVITENQLENVQAIKLLQ